MTTNLHAALACRVFGCLALAAAAAAAPPPATPIATATVPTAADTSAPAAFPRKHVNAWLCPMVPAGYAIPARTWDSIS